MKKSLLLFCALLMLGVSGVKAEQYIVPSASKVGSILSGGYYVITGMAQDGTTNKFLYDNGSRVYGSVITQDATAERYVWKIVGNPSDGYTLQNKATGNYMSLGSSNGSAISTGSTPQANVIFFNGDNYATVCNSTTNQAIDMASYGTSPTTWAGSTTSVDGSRRLLIYEASIVLNKVYTIKAYFSDYTDLYLYNNNGSIGFSASVTNGVKDYWIARSSGNGTYPWKFESGRGDGKFLSPTTGGLTTTGGWVQVPYCPSITTETCVHLRGSVIDADVTSGNIRNLATWNGLTKSGFANSGPNTGCFGGAHNNSDWSTDYIIEEAVGVDLYTVVSNINAGGVTYTPAYTGTAEQTNGGFYIFESAPSASNFTTNPVDNYTAGDVVVNTSAKTITVNYTANITYTLTDVNGAIYSWSASGSFGTAPSLTGCDGYSLSNESWDEGTRSYTADITFPFTISSNGVTNWTYIGSFAENTYTTSRFCWYVKSTDATKLYGGKDKLPTNQTGEQEKWEWSITPVFSNGAFSFTIKNASTESYITMAASPSAGFSNQISLTNTGTAFTFNNHRWKLPTATELYISQNSSSSAEQEVGVYGPNGAYGIHTGNNIAIIVPDDFTTLMTNLKTAYNNYNNYLLFVNTNPDKYTETVPGTMMEVYSSYSSTTNNVTKEPATAYLTGPQFSTYINAFNNAVAGLIPNVPAGSFIRIKTSPTFIPTPTYLTSANVNIGGYDNCLFTQDVNQINGAESIFYYDGSSLLTFSTGRWILNDAGFVIWDSNASPAASGTPIKFEKNAYGEIGMANIKFNNARYIFTSNSTPIYTWADTTPNNEKYNFVIEDVESLPVTITAANYATLYSPVALTIPSGVTAYTATISGDKLVLTPVSTTIPKNTGVLLYSATPDTYNFDITDDVDAIDGNAFSGTVATINRSKTAEVYNSYILSGGSSGIGFYRDGPTTLAGFKAFVDATPSGDVKQFLQFDFGDATAIQTISNALQSENREIYNLAGQRLNSLQRGVNIVNGKKVLVK